MRRCPACNTALGEQRIVCLSCGSLQYDAMNGDSIACDIHEREPATGICIMCGRPLCHDCTTVVGKKRFCQPGGHAAFYESSVPVFESSSEFESDMVEKNLSPSGIRCRVFAFHEFVDALWIPEMNLVRVWVPRQQERYAREILDSLNITDNAFR
jgi:hypothetical protein